jgi:hypothetical protein
MKKSRIFGLVLFFLVPAVCQTSAGGQAAAPVKYDVIPTPFFIREGAELKQMLRVLIDNPGAEIRSEMTAQLGKAKIVASFNRIPRGKSERAIYIPEVTGEQTARFIFSSGGRPAATVEKKLTPQRKWTIYLFHHSHTDIGYTELQSRIFKKHAEYLDDVIKFCRETESYPDDARFRWNVEVAWAVENYMKQRPESRVRELFDLVKQGRVEVGAWYLQLSDMFAHEELVRATYFASELARKHGLPITSAMNDDVTGWSWASPQVLSRAGVRYFATGINETRSRAALRRPCAFYWESPDGSRILHWNGEHYLFANYDLRIHEGEEKSRPALEKYLNGLEARGDYPFDLIAFNISAWVTDNCPPGRKLSDVVRDWNGRWAYPKLRLSVLREFFTEFEQKYGGQIPTYKLGWPDYWTDGIASTAFESGLNRLAHNELLTAEKAAAIAASLDREQEYPASEITEGQEISMFYDEHTWGAYNSIDEPDSELARGQWAFKSGFAYQAREVGRTLLAKNLGALAGRLKAPAEFSFIVFNPLSWPRTDVARAALPAPLVEKKGQFRLVDQRTGREEASQLIDDRTILFLARDIPSMGFAVYSIAPGPATAAAPSRKEQAGASLENNFYKLELDAVTGGIQSLFDKQTKSECVDGSSPFKLNQYIYENPEGGRKAVDNMEKRAEFKRWSPASARIWAGMTGPVASSLIARMTAPGCREIETEVILYEALKKIDIVNRLDKEDILVPEAVYFAFPFKIDQGSFVFEIADGQMRPEVDQLPNTTRDWLTVQDWVEVANSTQSLVWSPVEAPLVQFGDINTGKWLKKLEIRNPWVYSYAMNNYWMTNFKASQGGKVTFRYALTSRSSGADATQSTRFGGEVHAPLQVSWIPADSRGVRAETSHSFFGVDAPNVLIQAIKRAEDGRGLIVRLREVAGRPTEARVRSPFLVGSATAALVDLREQDERPVPVANGEAVIPLRAFGLETVRIVRSE